MTDEMIKPCAERGWIRGERERGRGKSEATLPFKTRHSLTHTVAVILEISQSIKVVTGKCPRSFLRENTIVSVAPFNAALHPTYCLLFTLVSVIETP